MRAQRQKPGRKFHLESRDGSSSGGTEEQCLAMVCGIGGAVPGIACAPVWHQDFGRQLAVLAG